jgi:hypothetical protein
MILGLGTPIQNPCGNHPIRARNYQRGNNAMHITAYCHEFGFTNSVPEMTVIGVHADTDPLDPNDTDATLLDHAKQRTWTRLMIEM